MAGENQSFDSPASSHSKDFHFTSLSHLEKQSLLPQEDPCEQPSPALSPAIVAVPGSTKFLDGVRGIAALLVFLHHFAPLFYIEEQHRGFCQKDPVTGQVWHHWTGLPFVRLLYTGGDAAVAIFFVLSGYVLTIGPLTKIVNVTREGGGQREEWRAALKSILSATVRRPIRLYLPAFCFACVYAVLRHSPAGPFGSYPDLEPTVSGELTQCVHAFIRFFNPFQQHGINRTWFEYGVVVWTIPIELKGSMLVFFLTALYAFAAPKRFYRRLYFFLLIALSILLLLAAQWTMALFVGGMVLALCDIYDSNITSLPLISRLPTSGKKAHPWINNTLLLIGVYLLSEPSHKSTISYSLHTPGWHYLTRLIPPAYLTTRPGGEVSWFDPEYFRFWTSAGSICTLYALLRLSWTQRLFLRRIPLYLGKISFLLYLSHVTVQGIVSPYILRPLGHWTLGTAPLGDEPYDNKLFLPDWGFEGFNLRYLAALVLILLPAVVVAHIGTVLIDRPALRLAHAVARFFRLTSSGASASRSAEISASATNRDDGRGSARNRSDAGGSGTRIFIGEKVDEARRLA